MPNKRISDLEERSVLYADSLGHSHHGQPNAFLSRNEDQDMLFLLAKTKVENQAINYKNFKSSILDNSLQMTANQLISGNKVFADNCSFLSRTNINQIIDTTIDGDINGQIIVGKTGFIENIEIYNSNNFETNLQINNEVNLIGDKTAKGNINIYGDSYINGDLSKDFDETLFGDLNISGDLYVNEGIVSINNSGTFIDFDNENIAISTNNHNNINIDQDEGIYLDSLYINQEGLVGVNTIKPIGELSLTGKAFIENVFVKEGSQFVQSLHFSSDSISFTKNLLKGKSSYLIDLNKNFNGPPTISVCLENTQGNEIIPFTISNLNKDDFTINFGKVLNDNNYIIHVTAIESDNFKDFNFISPSVPAANDKNIQLFYTIPQNETNNLQITFPQPFDSAPILNITIEGSNKIIPYTISSVSNTAYNITFGTSVNQNYKIHTLASIEGARFI